MKNKFIALTVLLIALFVLNSCELLNPLLGDNTNEPIQEEKITVSIESSSSAIQGQHHAVEVIFQNNLIENNKIGRFDFLFSYDASALTFQSADPGDFLVDCGWEYFTYGYDVVVDDSNSLATIRIRSIADTDNGSGNHPHCYNFNEISNQLVVLNFLVTNDRTYECYFAPINFYWKDCNDNVMRDSSDSQYYTSKTSSCDTNSFIRKIDFINGGIDIVCADSIDGRGDLNLNEINYEIADAVLYANYFIYGLSIFTVNTDGQVVASDINADGLTLTVADFVYLIRVLVGEALPYPKEAINEPSYIYGTFQHTDTGILRIFAARNIAAAHIVVQGNITPTLLADNMTMISNFDGTNTSILVYSLENNNFTGDMINIGSNTVVSLDMADHFGNQVIVTPLD